MQLTDGYSRLKNPPSGEYRLMTFEEAKNLTYGGTVQFSADGKTVRNCRLNGRVRTWKRSPERLEIPFKYGMYECGTAEWREGAMRFTNGGFLVVPIVGGF